MDGEARALAANEDVKEFYLGVAGDKRTEFMFASGVAGQVRRRARRTGPARRTAAFCSRKPTVPASRLLTIRAILSL